MSDITAEYVRSLFDYDPNEGVLRWSEGKGSRAKAGDPAGTVNRDGYVIIHIDRKSLKAHRLAWLYVYGEWPCGMIDHKNRVKSDNRIANLRVSSPSQNAANIGLPSTNKSGYRGVFFDKKSGRWLASIQKDGRSIRLGLYDDKTDAMAVRASEDKRLNGEFANVGHFDGSDIVVDIFDRRLDPFERQFLRNVGLKLYGPGEGR